MRAAGIIAAGLGERLRGSHPGLPKPLLPVAGRPLVHWVVSGLLAAGVERLTILFNSRGDAARAALERDFPRAALRFLRADTPTSFASFRLVAGTLAAEEEAFLMSTVDALIPPAEARRFAAEALAGSPRPWAAVALTRFVEDEKPLWTELGGDGLVRAFGDAARHDAVTCGLYA
ncbi:MAG: NTP transferase domain-containing protein, partial [Elusimicrobia bacterium]|nr:NTP transferase domain-containing protein [Elusimicrobiota bacterium]